MILLLPGVVLCSQLDYQRTREVMYEPVYTWLLYFGVLIIQSESQSAAGSIHHLKLQTLFSIFRTALLVGTGIDDLK